MKNFYQHSACDILVHNTEELIKERDIDLLESEDESVLLDWLSSYLLPLPLADSISGVIPPGPLSFTSLG